MGPYVTAAKRFGLEGCETLIPGFKEGIDRASELGRAVQVEPRLPPGRPQADPRLTPD